MTPRVCLLLGLLLLLAVPCARAQEEGVEGPPKPTQQEENEFADMMRDGKASNAAVFDKVIKHRVYSLTLPGNLETLPALRRKLKSDLTRADRAGDRAAHDAFNQQLLDQCYPLAIGQLPPGDHLNDPVARGAVQVNAMLIVAELNQQEVAGQTPAVPMAAALPKLLAAWAMPDLSDAVKAVVLQGIRRHAELGIADEQQRQAAQQAMLELLAAKSPPPTRDADVHDWFRRVAADTLAGIGAAGLKDDSAEVVQTLLGVIGDTDQSLAVRGTAAQALGRLNLKAPAGLNLSLAGYQVGQLAVAMTTAKPDSVARLKGHLQRIHEAVAGVGEGRGLLPAAAEPHKAFIEGLQQQFTPIKQAIDKLTDTDAAVVPQAAKEAADALAQWLAANAPQSKELVAASAPSP